MNKSLSKISELNLLQLMQEECQLLVRKDQWLQRDKEQQEALKLEEMDLHKNQHMAKHQEWAEAEEIWITIIIMPGETIPTLKVEAEKNWLKL